MRHRLLGLLILAAGGLLAAVILFDGGTPSAYLLVVAATLVATGLGLVLARGELLWLARVGRGANRQEELIARLVEAEEQDDGSPEPDRLLRAFAVTKDDDGRLRSVDRSEVDTYFQCLLVRWRGPLALAMSGLDDEDATALADRLGGAATELRSDILQAERYLGDLLFREPWDKRPYTEILADLDALLRRLGDGRWGDASAGGT
jgi:hypothetical protein